MTETQRTGLWLVAALASFVSAAASAYEHRFVVAALAVVAGAAALVNVFVARRRDRPRQPW